MTDNEDKSLVGLKDFQRRTVEYVFDRLHANEGSARFLVADEVGLGKTLIARGIIGKTLERLKNKKQVNIIYICSNSSIAKQNIKRLNITGRDDFEMATRLTMIPSQVKNLQSNDVNFISLTPKTTFDHASTRGGRSAERAIIYTILESLPFAHGARRIRLQNGLFNLLQLNMRRDNWKRRVKRVTENGLDRQLSVSFRKVISADKPLYSDLKECCELFAHYRKRDRIPTNQRDICYDVIARLRNRLAIVCLDALNPDLIILDEFQRFKQLLEADDDASQLAKALFNERDVRILLLSATPYKMYTKYCDEDNNHYEDFLKTLEFLCNDSHKIDTIKTLIVQYREMLQLLASGVGSDAVNNSAKMAFQNALLQVMCRTERTTSTHEHNAMMKLVSSKTDLTVDDLNHLATADNLSLQTDGPELVEYWKSTPYLVNFLRRYEFRRKLENHLTSPTGKLRRAIVAMTHQQLKKREFENYRAIEPGNPQMRGLMADTLDNGLWELLWMQPSLPYVQPEGEFENKEKLTKTLVFSKWHAVPDAIASLVSYEAERRMLGDEPIKHSELKDKIAQPLRFAKSSGRLTGMSVVAWMLPSPTLATLIDPLSIAAKFNNGPMLAAEMKEVAIEKCEQLLLTLPDGDDSLRVDASWYWAAPMLLESSSELLNWCKGENEWRRAESKDSSATSFDEHLVHLVEVIDSPLQLGKKPDDLAVVLAELALAGPGTCALRSLLRLNPAIDASDTAALSAAAAIASGFRSLYNMPQNVAMLRRGHDLPYWRVTLDYGLRGNLQSVLDEYVHVLKESLGVFQAKPEEQLKEISDHIRTVLSMRAAQVRLDELKRAGTGFEFIDFNARCRFALRFADIKDGDNNAVLRADTVRDAFNSPFRPFVLASTSIGQEGLDFHTWCHAVMHWNLPSNPVDLEQREGRVHRYKGHAVRKNVAEKYGLQSLDGLSDDECVDPWSILFDQASADKQDGQSDLVPYWIFEEGSARIERRIPILPYSKEVQKLKSLTETLANYRLVFGQPRQEDMVEQLNKVDGDVEIRDFLVDLRPPIER